MYYVNKIVGWCLSPMGMLFLGLLVGVAIRCRCRKVGSLLIGVVLVFFWAMSCGVTTRWIGVPLEGEEVDIDHSTFGTHASSLKYDAIVLLGGGMGAHEKCGRAEMFQGADRVWHAAKLWKAYHVEGDGMKMTLSGGRAAKSTIPLLRDFGVEGDVFLVFEEARNTEEEAKLIKEKLAHHSSTSTSNSNSAKPKVLLVTSAWHMPRAKMLFERAGLEVEPAPCDYEMHYVAEEPLKIKDFFPSAESLERNSAAIKEWVARACYAIKR